MQVPGTDDLLRRNPTLTQNQDTRDGFTTALESPPRDRLTPSQNVTL